MGMEVVVFSGTDSKRDEAMKFGAAEFVATKGVKQFQGVQPNDHLLITTSFLPDFFTVSALRESLSVKRIPKIHANSEAIRKDLSSYDLNGCRTKSCAAIDQ
jgi:hypothetical protein